MRLPLSRPLTAVPWCAVYKRTINTYLCSEWWEEEAENVGALKANIVKRPPAPFFHGTQYFLWSIMKILKLMPVSLLSLCLFCFPLSLWCWEHCLLKSRCSTNSCCMNEWVSESVNEYMQRHSESFHGYSQLRRLSPGRAMRGRGTEWFGVGVLGFKPKWLLLAMWPWMGYLTSLCHVAYLHNGNSNGTQCIALYED